MNEQLQRKYFVFCKEADMPEVRKFRQSLLAELKSRIKNSAYEQDIVRPILVKVQLIKLKPIEQCMKDLEKFLKKDSLSEKKVTLIFFNPSELGLIAAVCQELSKQLERKVIYIGDDSNIVTKLDRHKVHVLEKADPQFLANTIVRITKDSGCT